MLLLFMKLTLDDEDVEQLFYKFRCHVCFGGNLFHVLSVDQARGNEQKTENSQDKTLHL